MIKPSEIQQKANAVGVRDQQIEKDYILSWILFGISNHKPLSTTIVFKGGTVLKKKLEERLPQYNGRWKSSMSEQIKDLPNFDQIEREVQRHLKKLKF